MINPNHFPGDNPAAASRDRRWLTDSTAWPGRATSTPAATRSSSRWSGSTN